MDTVTFKSFLNQKKLRLTPQRLAVLNAILRAENRHLSAGELFDAVRETNSGIGIATVYKTLRLLEQEGLLSKIELPDKTAHYGINDGKSVCHLICSKCGKIIEVGDDRVRRALELLLAGSRFTFRQGSIRIYGICGDCARSGQSPASPHEPGNPPCPAARNVRRG